MSWSVALGAFAGTFAGMGVIAIALYLIVRRFQRHAEQLQEELADNPKFPPSAGDGIEDREVEP